MKKSRYTETQIIKVLKEVEAGRLVKEVCREYGISDATYYNWKSKYGGMEASDALCARLVVTSLDLPNGQYRANRE